MQTAEKMFDIQGKVAIVTGASVGIGAQFSRFLASQGARVALLARRKHLLDELAGELTAEGHEAIAIQCDVLNEAAIISAIAEVVKQFGTIDILVNNAGTAAIVDALDQTKDEWDTVIGTNVTGVYLMAREAAKIMKENGGGKIINIGSIHSNQALSHRMHHTSSYHASKGAIPNLTRTLASEWAPYNIRVNAIGPAYMPTEMTEGLIDLPAFTEFVNWRCPMGRVGQPYELNGALLYFASDASTYTTGQLLNVDGGWNAI